MFICIDCIIPHNYAFIKAYIRIIMKYYSLQILEADKSDRMSSGSGERNRILFHVIGWRKPDFSTMQCLTANVCKAAAIHIVPGKRIALPRKSGHESDGFDRFSNELQQDCNALLPELFAIESQH